MDHVQILRPQFIFVLSALICAPLAAFSQPGSIDGVPIQAIEDYPTTHPHELKFGFDVYPFNAYYTSLAVSGSYTFHFNDKYGWEALRGLYSFNFDKGLTSELADKYSVTPESINKLQYIFSSSFQYSPAMGKMIVLHDYLRYFKTSLLSGFSFVSTSHSNRFGVHFGASFNIYMSDRFSCSLEARNHLTFPKISNFVTFGIQTGFGVK